MMRGVPSVEVLTRRDPRFGGGWQCPVVVAAVSVVVGAALLLIPSDRRVVEGLLLDESSQRLRELAAEHGEGDPDREVLPFLAARLTEDEWENPAFLGTVLTMASETADPGAMFEALEEVGIPVAQKAAIAVTLALRADAFAAGDGGRLAARIAEFARGNMPCEPELVMVPARAYRRAGKPGRAFQLMQRVAKAAGTERLPREFKSLFRDLAFETGHAEIAFAMVLDLWREAGAAASPDALRSGALDTELDAFLKGAEASGRGEEAVAVLEERLADHPLLHRPFGAGLSGVDRELVASFNKYAPVLGRLSEWSGAPGRAFDVYSRLALHGDAVARARCRELHPGLYRGEELTAVLLRNADALEPAETEQLAGLLGSAGRVDEAERQYQRLMASQPERRAEFLAILGELMEEHGAPERALELLVAAHDAGHDAAGPALGRVLVVLGRYPQALAHYGAMRRHDHETADAYFHVATAMGDDAAAIGALKLRLEHASPPLVPDFVSLAEACARAGRMEEAEATFREGLRLHPESRELHLRFAVMLGAARRDREALDLLLSRVEHATDPAAVARLGDFSIDRRDYPRVLAWLGGEGIERRVPLSDETKELVADMYVHTGRRERALLLVAELPDNPRFAETKASVLFLNGRLREAEDQQQAHLDNAGRHSVEAWRQMGRIRRALGRERDARECFVMALALLHQNLPASEAVGKAGTSVSINQHGIHNP